MTIAAHIVARRTDTDLNERLILGPIMPQATIAMILPNAHRTYRVLDLVAVERARQHRLIAEKAIPFDCADPAVPVAEKLPVLVEEVGEVAEAIQLLHLSSGPGRQLIQERVREELIQVAAVAVAMAESLSQEAGR